MVIFHKQQANPEYTVYMVLFIFNSNSRTLTDHNKSIRVIGMGVACLRVTSGVLGLDLGTWELLLIKFMNLTIYPVFFFFAFSGFYFYTFLY